MVKNSLDIPELVKQEIYRYDPHAEIILFGSRARGDFNRHSDWDFLILLNDEIFSKQIKDEIRDNLYELELKTNSVISNLIHPKGEWQKMGASPFYLTIKNEGLTA